MYQLMRVMHRVMFICPVLGLDPEFEELCVKVKTALDEDDRSIPESIYTWKALGSRCVFAVHITLQGHARGKLTSVP